MKKASGSSFDDGRPFLLRVMMMSYYIVSAEEGEMSVSFAIA